MKIALIRKHYTDFGGAERYVAALLKTLLAQGHDAHIFAQTWNSDQRAVFHQVPVPKGVSFLEVALFARRVGSLLREADYDVIHGFERTFFQDIYRAGDGCHREWLERRRVADNLIKRKTYLLNPRHRVMLSLEEKIYRDPRLKFVIAISKRVKEEIIRHYGFPEERIKVIYNGLYRTPEELRGGAGLPEGFERRPNERMALYVGSGFERKNLATAIRALAIISDPAVRLWVVGRDRTGAYRRLADRLGLKDRVVFAGPQKDPVPFYTHAHAFVLPTLYEPFGSACLEASASGLPVVTTRVAGFSELIEPGVTGFVVEDPMNAEEVAHGITSALALGKIDPPVYSTIEDNVREVLNLYRAVTG